MTRVLTLLAATLLVLVITAGVVVVTERTASAGRTNLLCADALRGKAKWSTDWDRGTLDPQIRQPIEADIARYCG